MNTIMIVTVILSVVVTMWIGLKRWHRVRKPAALPSVEQISEEQRRAKRDELHDWDHQFAAVDPPPPVRHVPGDGCDTTELHAMGRGVVRTNHIPREDTL